MVNTKKSLIRQRTQEQVVLYKKGVGRLEIARNERGQSNEVVPLAKAWFALEYAVCFFVCAKYSQSIFKTRTKHILMRKYLF